MNIAAIILAAGLSSRMGDFKPLLRLGGKTLLEHCRDLFQAVDLAEIVVVAGHCAEKTGNEAASLGMRWVRNGDFHTGMFSSIRCAVTALPKDIDAFFVLPVDIPLIRPVTLRTLLASFSDNDALVVYPTFAGRRGHPPVISATLIPAIMDYEGAGGLEALLRQHKGMDVAVWDEGIHMDADTPEDLPPLQQRQAHFAIPTRREAETLAELQLSDRGLAHGRLVGHAALAIARALDDKGIALNMDLIYGAALLHDVAKGQPRHEIRGAEILSSLGLSEIAEIVASHKDLDAPANGRPAEKEIVCLADKLISGARRVRVEERYAEKLLLFKKKSGMYQEIMRRKKRALALKALVEKAAANSLESILKKSFLQN
ncbi:MAG: hypothetical protein VR65_00855 [Desulfobulbaceae bacterium BRH_c16a]|nr:MAG: hypothetical protein VR65_00855 [Desulfobulbaceae bacterium BRH_c16a]